MLGVCIGEKIDWCEDYVRLLLAQADFGVLGLLWAQSKASHGTISKYLHPAPLLLSSSPLHLLTEI